MVVKGNEVAPVVNEGVRGGDGAVFAHLLAGEAAGSKIRAIALNRLTPGGSIGLHKHEGEEDFYFCLSGEGLVTDDTGEHPFTEGTFQITRSGETQALKNTGKTELIFLAGLIQN